MCRLIGAVPLTFLASYHRSLVLSPSRSPMNRTADLNFVAVLPYTDRTMSFFSLLHGIPGVRRAIFRDAEGALLEGMGGVTADTENVTALVPETCVPLAALLPQRMQLATLIAPPSRQTLVR